VSVRCQQDELYRSEETISQGRPLTQSEIRALVDRVRDSEWWERNVPQVRYVEVFFRERSREGSVGAWDRVRGCGVMEMAPCHMAELPIIHELAHVVADALWGNGRGCGHDPRFARTYLNLVYVAFGSERYLELYEAFTRDGIDFA
jgi:hypothetical protein